MPRKAATQVPLGPIKLVQRGQYWYAHYKDEAGIRQRTSLNVGNLKVATKEAREIAELLENGDFGAVKDRQLNRRRTFSDFAAEFQEKQREWAESTQQA